MNRDLQCRIPMSRPAAGRRYAPWTRATGNSRCVTPGRARSRGSSRWDWRDSASGTDARHPGRRPTVYPVGGRDGTPSVESPFASAGCELAASPDCSVRLFRLLGPASEAANRKNDGGDSSAPGRARRAPLKASCRPPSAQQRHPDGAERPPPTGRTHRMATWYYQGQGRRALFRRSAWLRVLPCPPGVLSAPLARVPSVSRHPPLGVSKSQSPCPYSRCVRAFGSACRAF
jgi:hypothetical protein